MKNLKKQSPSLDTYISWTNLTAAYLESHKKTDKGSMFHPRSIYSFVQLTN